MRSTGLLASVPAQTAFVSAKTKHHEREKLMTDRMPCTQQLALSMIFGNQTFPIHPLDMTWPDPSDPSQQTCIGAIQYSSNLGKTGDFILGSSFLKNVYSIYQYPDNPGRGTWQPTVGMVSLTNASVASEDFYAVRVQRQSLTDVSSNHNTGVGASNPSSTSTAHQSADNAESKKVLSSAMIAGISVAALFIFAAGVFCAWWFWLRRRFGKNGKVIYAEPAERGSGHRTTPSASSGRNRKHDAAQRQKSMVEGYSDYEDSWVSTTEGGESIRLGYLPEVVEEDNPHADVGPRSSGASSSRNSSPRRRSDFTDVEDMETEDELRDDVNPFDSPDAGVNKARRGSSASRSISMARDDDLGLPRHTSVYGYPGSTWSMSGPFPSPNRTSSIRPDTSPMYDIRSSDYFTVDTPASGKEGRRGSFTNGSGSTGKRDSSANGARGRSPGKKNGILDDTLVEEPVEEAGLGRKE